jgi:hypothetical protein
MAPNSDQVRLLSIEDGRTPDGKPGHVVKLGFFVSEREPMVTVSGPSRRLSTTTPILFEQHGLTSMRCVATWRLRRSLGA